MDNESFGNNEEMTRELKTLLGQHNNNIDQVKKVIYKHLIVCRISGYLSLITALGFAIFIISVSPWKCMTSKCPPGAMDGLAFLVMPIIFFLIISIVLIRGVIKTKRLLKYASSFDIFQHIKDASIDHNTPR